MRTLETHQSPIWYKREHWVILIAATMIIAASSRSQGSSGTEASLETRYLIDVPTAGIIPHDNIALDVDFFQAGGVLTRVSFGAFHRALIGVSYGGSHLIGADAADWNNSPGFTIKIRFIDETVSVPAVALGFDSQGREAFVGSLTRYVIKSPGFYIVGSKNYRAFGFLSFHGGVNYSLERSDGDDDINFFGGVEKTFGPFLSFLGEYNLGMNDSNQGALGRGRGYLNLGLRASLGSGVTFGFSLKDLFRNQDEGFANRTMSIEYVKPL